MVDFAELRRRSYEAMDDAGRARVDAYWAAEAKADLTLSDIEATFTTRAWKTAEVVKTYNRLLKVRIESRGEGDDFREVIDFKNAVTGHETYKLDGDFAKFIKEASEKESGLFCICAGTPGTYDECSVAAADVLAYLEKQRPQLFDVPTDTVTP